MFICIMTNLLRYFMKIHVPLLSKLTSICNYNHLLRQGVSLLIGTCIFITRSLLYCIAKLINEWLTYHWEIPIKWSPQKDNRYCIYSKGECIFEKTYLPWETPTNTQERFYFPCNKFRVKTERDLYNTCTKM
jgi:hypothetical protein